MKRILMLLMAFACSAVSMAQTASSNFQDGKIWFKIEDDVLPGKVTGNNFTNISLRVLPFLEKIDKQVSIKQLSMPFVAAKTSAKLQRTYQLQLNDATQVAGAIELLKQCGEIEYAERVPLHRTSITPNDSYYGPQWHLQLIGAPAAWDYFSTGSNVVIAIVDDAFEIAHPDLAPNLWVNAGEIPNNGIDDDNNGYTDDVNGYDVADFDNDPTPPDFTFNHGTAVSGMASAATNNMIGVAGIGYSCKLMTVKSSISQGQAGMITDGYAGVVYAAATGADIINMSWGDTMYFITGQNVMDYAVSEGCILVAAAGNNDNDVPEYPAAYNNVLSVAATNSGDVKASFSSYGSWVDVSAPGASVYTTQVNTAYDNSSGTSFSSPLVAGLLALMKSLAPSMPNYALVNCMLNTADNIDATNPWYVGALGSGRVNAEEAMQCVHTALTLQPVAGFMANHTAITAGGNVVFTDTSANIPWNWVWSFPGGTPSTYTGQTPPPVFYSVAGTYNVSLTVTNGNGSNTQTTNSYITVGNTIPCRSVNFPLPAGWTGANYNEGPNNGYTNGTNVYGDKEKAMYYDMSATPATFLTKTNIAFSKASVSSAAKTVAIKIYDGTTGTPEALLGYEDVLMSAIIPKAQTGNYTQVEFDPAVALPASGKFFVSVDISNLCWTCSPRDTLAIVSNMDGQTMPSAIWDRQSDDTWRQYGTPGTFTQSASLIMHPYLTNQPALATFTETANDICVGQSITFDAAGSVAQDSLMWYLPGTSNNVVTGNALTTAVYTSAGTYVAELHVKGGGCHQVRRDTVVVTVSQLPNVNISANINDVCQGTPVTLTAFGADGYTWLPSTGLNTTSGSTVICTAATTTIYTATGTNAAGCSRDGVTQVRINPLPAPVINQQGNTLSVTGYAAYQWLLNNQPLNNAGSGTHVAETSGSYSVLVTDANGCSDTSAAVDVLVNGIGRITDSGFNVYPNPTNGILSLQLNDGVSVEQIDICNTLGQIIAITHATLINGNTYTLDLTNYADGIYLLRLQYNNTVHTTRVVLAR